LFYLLRLLVLIFTLAS